MLSSLEQKYAELVGQLQVLTDKLTAFIDGDENVTITTGNGVVKSLAGTIKDITSIRYIQRVKDHKLYQNMVDDTELVDGMLIRVWGDDPGIIGLYTRTDGSYVKIGYADIYDLISLN